MILRIAMITTTMVIGDGKQDHDHEDHDEFNS